MKAYMSASGIKKYRSCPKQWWYRYISDAPEKPSETKYLDLGNAVHDALEDWLKRGRPHEDTLITLYEVLAEEKDVPDDMWDTGKDCVQRAAEYIDKRDPEILGIEAEETFQISRPDVDSEIKAKMDVATDTEIWDWKTGSIRDDTGAEEKIQGAVYMAAYRVKYGHPPEKIRFVYLKEEAVRTIEPNDDTWDFMLQFARGLAASKESGEFPAQPGEHCYWCDYEFSCAESGVGIGENFDWEDYTQL